MNTITIKRMKLEFISNVTPSANVALMVDALLNDKRRLTPTTWRGRRNVRESWDLCKRMKWHGKGEINHG